MKLENKEYLTKQIITYIGNKRNLLSHINTEVCEIKSNLKKDKIISADLFSGSGIVSRMLKQHSEKIIVNDLEEYSGVINSCYLTNKDDFPNDKYMKYKKIILEECNNKKVSGIITKNYAPEKDDEIKIGERVFYSRNNALLIDTYRFLIDDIINEEGMKKFFLAPLITEASIHVNTSGVFKGFYKDKTTGKGCFGGTGKNALPRILSNVELPKPIFSNFNSNIEIYTQDTIELSKNLSNIDITYLDPPYNQHPYGSNYFMLNLILKNRLDTEISKVSGITQDWKRSCFNKERYALTSLEEIIRNIDSKYLIISYNSEGFIGFEEMKQMLKKYGIVKTTNIRYNTFRGSRNLKSRNSYVSEYLFILKKL